MAPIPHGAAARALPPCDLVMKGGVTSGIVYPSLVLKLAEHYRFASIGGTSAGAIAAALSAAAEYGRQLDNGGGTAKLDAALDVARGARRHRGPLPADARHEAAVRGDHQGAVGQAVAVAADRVRRGVAAKRRARAVVVGLLLFLALLLSVAGAFWKFSTAIAVAWTILVALPLLVLVVVATALAALGGLLLQTVRALGDSDFGMCPGTHQPGGSGEAVVEWLHQHIQDCAGKPLDEPLTFRDLAEQGIDVTMITTDLSLARPVRVPHGLDAYRFDVEKMRERFPAAVVEAMLDRSRGRPALSEDADEDLPVLVGVRLSLSFPLLLSAMPLYQESALDTPRPNLFSDGGISSNFPVQFFDAWFPGRPTFAIDLAEYPAGDDREVFMLTNPLDPAVPRWDAVDSLPGFLSHIKDTAQNWRDTLQSELPGFRDRVCQIRFDKGQGGLYLDMDAATIADLVRRGGLAGETILTTFDAHQWDQHRWVRYLTLMGLLEDNLHHAGPPFGAFAPQLAQGLPDVQVYRGGHDAQWCVAGPARHGGAAGARRRLGSGAARRGLPHGRAPAPRPGHARRPARLTGTRALRPRSAAAG